MRRFTIGRYRDLPDRPPKLGPYVRIDYDGLPINHAMFPNCLYGNGFRDVTYDEVYSTIDF